MTSRSDSSNSWTCCLIYIKSTEREGTHVNSANYSLVACRKEVQERMEEGLECSIFIRFQKTYKGETHHKVGLSFPAPHKPACLNTFTYTCILLYIKICIYMHKQKSLYIIYIYMSSVRLKSLREINRDTYKKNRYGKVEYSNPLPKTQALSNFGLQST